MNRRELMRLLAATGGGTCMARFAGATAPAVVLERGGAPGATIPYDFVGLSYERAQLSNPAFFSADNRTLVRLFRDLSPAGNLRLGGSSGEHTRYVGDAVPVPAFEVFGPEHNRTVKDGLSVSDTALRALRGFLDATGWSCLYGLNMAQATPEGAAHEAAVVQRILGPRLSALQIGNEPDSFRNRFRPAGWGPQDYLVEWAGFHGAIVAAAPGVRFAGPDISNKLDYLTAFAAMAPRYPDIALLTGHYYAMGPAASPDATLAQLREAEPRTTTFRTAGFAVVDAARRVSGLPYRMAEGNSCWDGGKPGVSDVHASALWGADAMLRFARHGWCGINWHGGGYGHYAPIVGTPSAGFARRPLYFGTQFAGALVGATVLHTVPPIDPALGYHALRQAGRERIVVINTSDDPVPVILPGLPEAGVSVLTGPSAAVKGATRLLHVAQPPRRAVTIPPVTAMLFTLSRRG